MELFQNVVRRKNFDDKRYRLIQCADLTVRQIQLDKSGGMARGQTNIYFALNSNPHLYLCRAFVM